MVRELLARDPNLWLITVVDDPGAPTGRVVGFVPLRHP